MHASSICSGWRRSSPACQRRRRRPRPPEKASAWVRSAAGMPVPSLPHCPGDGADPGRRPRRLLCFSRCRHAGSPPFHRAGSPNPLPSIWPLRPEFLNQESERTREGICPFPLQRAGYQPVKKNGGSIILAYIAKYNCYFKSTMDCSRDQHIPKPKSITPGNQLSPLRSPQRRVYAPFQQALLFTSKQLQAAALEEAADCWGVAS
uniref:Uncharacterized protein n=1 Tax=Leersia perrieri TaxID=77586 RepID=A0A0D9XPY4_9ORYZ